MTVLSIVGIGVLIVLIVVAIRRVTQIVPQEERLVIYRLGRFHRLAGPGLVMVLPNLDQVVKTIRVRDQPYEVRVDGLFAFGVPTELTLNLWCRFDLAQAAGGDFEKLAALVQLSDAERRRQLDVKVREALVRQIAALQERRPLDDDASILEGVMALAGGSPRYNELLEAVKQDLQETLPAVGAILNPDQSITLTKRGISDEIIEAVKRRRSRTIDSQWLANYAQQLRQQFPGVSDAVLAQMLASIEGVDVGKVQRFFVGREGPGGPEPEVEVELESSGDSDNLNFIAKPKLGREGVGTDSRAGRAEGDGVARPGTPGRLTQDDLAMLKRVPRKDRNQRVSA